MKAKYAVLTTKHHDDFLLWPSATSTHTIAHSSPWYANSGNMDIVQQYVTAFNAAGIAPCLYFSIWSRNFEVTSPTYTDAQYLTYVQAQLTELLSNYGTIPGIWFDGGAWHFSSVSKPNYYPWASYKARETFIRALQPNIVIVDNNHLEDVTTSDINEFEQTTPDGILYCSEWCDPIRQDDSWFYLTPTSAPETAAFLLGNLATAQSLNAAYLIAITPDTTGVIPSAQVTVMGQIGAGH